MGYKVRRIVRSRSQGQSLVEMALALPVLLLMFLGMVEMGMLLRAHLVIANANREAARFASRSLGIEEEAIYERALTSFAGQLPAELEGANANTKIIVTRFQIPSAKAEAATYDGPYSTGDLSDLSQIGDPAVFAAKLKAENDQFNDDLIKSQADAMRTSQDVVVVEIYYYHYEVLNAPIVEWIFPNPMVVHSSTMMRVGTGRVF